MPEIPPQAVQAAALALAECSRPVDGTPCEVCLPRAERTLRDLAAIGMVVIRAGGVPTGSVQTAPESTETGREAVPRLLGSSDDGTPPESRTALRERYEGAIRSVLEREAPTWKRLAWPASHAVLAVRDDALAYLRERLHLVDGMRQQNLDAAASALQRAEQAEAAIARVRRLCDLTIAASCRVQAIDQAVDTLAALEMTAKDVAACGDRCPQVYGTREVVCTLPKGHAAHRSGGTAWEALCDEVAQRAEQDSAALARVRALAEQAHPAGVAACTCWDCEDDEKPNCEQGRTLAWTLDPAAVLAALDVPADGAPTPATEETDR